MVDRDVQRLMTKQSFLDESAGLRYSSPLFSMLAHQCAGDEAILEFGSVARAGQSAGLLILMAAQYLLLKSPDSALARYFPSLTDDPRPSSEAFPVFREFCLQRRSELMDLVAHRTVNANMVERASCILPALQYVSTRANEPLTLLDLCCSAGLNLLFDQYHYDYGSAGQSGVYDSPVKLTCKVIGTARPPVNGLPPIARRLGVDLVAIDTSDPSERLWMEAMLCPEWTSERKQLKLALPIRAAHRLQVVMGDAVEVLPRLLHELPGSLCVLHSICMLQWPAASKRKLDEILRAASQHREIHRVAIEVPANEPPQTVRARLTRLARAGVSILQKSFPADIQYTRYEKGAATSHILGQGDGFGTWLDWYPEPRASTPASA
jgi:hypothetical protein